MLTNHLNSKRATFQLCIFSVVISSSVTITTVQQASFKQGRIKVKFTKAMSASVSSMSVSSTDNKLLTGTKSFDAVSKKYSARRMRRLFAEHPNPVVEAKHKKQGLHLWYVVEIDENDNPLEVANAYNQLEEVKVAEVEKEKVLPPSEVIEYKAGISTISTEEMPFNDPSLADQWHYNNTEQLAGEIARSD